MCKFSQLYACHELFLKWTYIILYAYFILISEDMKKQKTKNVERHASGLSKLKYT